MLRGSLFARPSATLHFVQGSYGLGFQPTPAQRLRIEPILQKQKILHKLFIMDWEQLHREVTVTHSRSSGAGGQHVNKVATRVEMVFYPATSAVLSDTEKAYIQRNLSSKLTKDGALRVAADDTRSQALNRRRAWAKLRRLIEKGIRPPRPPRKAGAFKPNRRKRREAKERRSQTKSLRGKVQDW